MEFKIVSILLIFLGLTVQSQKLDLSNTIDKSIQIQESSSERVYSVYKVKFRDDKVRVYCQSTKYLIAGLTKEFGYDEFSYIGDYIEIDRKQAWYSLRSFNEFGEDEIGNFDKERWKLIVYEYYENLILSKSENLTKDDIINKIISEGVNLEDVRFSNSLNSNENQRVSFIFQMFCQGLVLSENHMQELKCVDEEEFTKWYEKVYK